MSISRSSSRRFARSSAPDLRGVPDAALALLLFTVGSETPLLALLALRRPRILAAVAVPFIALAALALAVGRVVPGAAAGALVLALSPAELAAPALARALGGRAETAAAAVTGTLVVSLALLLAVGGANGAALLNSALLAFVAGAAIAGSLPTVRDALLPAIRAASYLALAILAGTAIWRALPALGVEAVAAAVAFLVVGALAAALVVVALGGEWRSLALGGASRDFAVGATVAAQVAGDAAAAVPLVYGGLLFGFGAVAILARRLAR